MGYLINSGSNKEIAEEIIKEVLKNVWQKAYKFDYMRRNVNTWIFSIIRNKRIDRLCKNENPLYNTLDSIDASYADENDKKKDLEIKINEMKFKLNEK